MFRYLNNNKGAIAVLVAGAMVALLGITALVVDIGLLVNRKAELQKACDAAALAGAQELPEDTASATTVATNYAVENGIASPTVTITDSNKKITVSAEEQVNFFFARVLGIDNGAVATSATAMVAPVSEIYNGLRPFGVEKEEYVEGAEVVLKTGAHDSDSGNFYPISLDGTGADIYKNTIINGSTNGFSVGDYVFTETGNMVGPTKTAIDDLLRQCTHTPECTSTSYEPDCPRVVTVPLVVWTGEESGKSKIEIVGFARFFLEGVRNNGGMTEVTGRFIEEITVGGMSHGQTDYGLRGVRLVN